MSEIKMFAVSYINFFDNDLQIDYCAAKDWRDALASTFCNEEDMDYLSEDYEQARADAFNGDWMFCVKEYPYEVGT